MASDTSLEWLTAARGEDESALYSKIEEKDCSLSYYLGDNYTPMQVGNKLSDQYIS